MTGEATGEPAGDGPDEPATPPPTRRPRWGVVDALVGLVIALVASSVASGIVLGATGQDDLDDASLVTVALLQVPLWLGLLGWPLLVSRRKGNGPVEDFGLRARQDQVAAGFGIGVLAQAVVVPLLYLPIFELFDSLDSEDVSEQARELTDRATGLGIVLLVLVVVVGAPIVEELFYRGLLLRSLDRHLPTWAAVVLSSVLFGLSHFQGIQLPALVLFGVLAAVLAVRTGNLGASIAAHMGFNAWTVFALLVLD